MSQITHGTFTIERRFPVAPRRVYAAFVDPETKARWFDGPPGWASSSVSGRSG
jgi:uncharacterized protein YndB with AHSA1/START domain